MSTDTNEDVKLELEVKVASPSPCERHVTVTISRTDIDRYFNDAFSEMMPSATVPGFRAGRAPRKIVEQRYRNDVKDQIKGSLLMDSLTQITEEQEFSAISEPELNLEAVEIPAEGSMTFEFDIEVRPEFDLPEWKGLKVDRPTQEFTEADVEEQLTTMLSRYGQLNPTEEKASEGDYLSLNITSTVDGEEVAKHQEMVLRIQPTLSLVDCKIEGFGKLVQGVKTGDKKSTEVTLSQDAPNEKLRGKKATLEFEILEVKQLELPELTEEFLKEIGNFEDEPALRSAVKQNLERQLEYQQQQQSREQISSLLTDSADWELPPALLKRQAVRELERAVMELRRSGFSETEIRARENELRQNSSETTAKALKEHFVLERIAEEQEIDVTEGDYEKEIFLISTQSGESPRRIRAQLEKRGMMDVLRNQIIERKVIELVQSEAKFNNIPFEGEKSDTEAVHIAAGGKVEATAIPEAVEETAAEENE